MKEERICEGVDVEGRVSGDELGKIVGGIRGGDVEECRS